jgi:hypothetical protein
MPVSERTTERTSPAAPSSLPQDVVLRATAIMGLLGVAVIHFAQVVPTMKATPYLGVAFVALALGGVAVVYQLLHGDTRAIWAEVMVLNVLAIGGYAFTRTFSTFLDNQDVGNWSEMLGVAALFVEGLLVLLSVHVLAGRAAPQPVGAAVASESRPVRPAERVGRSSGSYGSNGSNGPTSDEYPAEVSGAFARTLARR